MTTAQALYKSARFMYYRTGSRVMLMAAGFVYDAAEAVVLFYSIREKRDA